jgi:hypothetical protein
MKQQGIFCNQRQKNKTSTLAALGGILQWLSRQLLTGASQLCSSLVKE